MGQDLQGNDVSFATFLLSHLPEDSSYDPSDLKACIRCTGSVEKGRLSEDRAAAVRRVRRMVQIRSSHRRPAGLPHRSGSRIFRISRTHFWADLPSEQRRPSVQWLSAVIEGDESLHYDTMSRAKDQRIHARCPQHLETFVRRRGLRGHQRLLPIPTQRQTGID